MSSERWKRVKELFTEAAELPASERESFVAAQAAGDPELGAEVRRLLEFHDQSRAALDQPPVEGQFLPGAYHPQVFQPGETVNGRFRVVRLLGEGGMGQVFEAEDLQLGTRVALKTLKPHLMDEAKLTARFRQEVHLARQVAHPNVCRVFDLGQREGSAAQPALFFSMELLQGETLSQRIARTGRTRLDEAAPLIGQMCAALEAAHAAGVVHRDFKSSNIFLTGPGAGAGGGASERLVVTDFGLSRPYTGAEQSATAPTTSAGTAIGTPAYMAPEQIEGRAATPASDLYALGVVMYEMATGEQPFSANSPLAMLARKLKHDAPSPRKSAPGIERAWEAAIARCLEREPEDRFASAAEVAAALGLQPASSSHGSRRLGLLLFQHRWAGRKWRRRLAVGAALALSGFASWWTLVRPQSHVPPAAAARWYEQGVEAMAGNAHVTASRLLEQAVQADPDFALARAHLATAYTELDIPGKAKDEMLRVAGLTGDGRRLPRRERLRIEAARHMATSDFGSAAKALEELQQAEEGRARVLPLVELAKARERAGDRNAALEAARQAIAIDGQHPTPRLHLGILEYRAGRFDTALGALAEAERLFELQGLDEGVSEAVLQRAFALERARRSAESAEGARRVAERARTLRHPWHLARALFHQARLESEAGNLPAARTLIGEGVALASEERMTSIVARGLNDLGFTFLTQSRLKEAEETFRESIAIARRAGNEMTELDSTIQLVQTLIRAKRLDEGVAALGPALATLRKTPGPLLGTALAIHINALIDLGKLDEAYAASEELLAFSRRRNDGEGALRARERLDHIRGARGEFPAAVESGLQRIAEYRAQGQQVRVISTLISVGHREAILGRKQDFERHFAEAGKLAEALGDGGAYLRFRLWRTRAQIAEMEGQAGEAARLAGQALGLAAKGTPTTDLDVIAAYAHCVTATTSGTGTLERLAAAAKRAEADLALAKCYLRAGREGDAAVPARRALEAAAKAGSRLDELQAAWALAKSAARSPEAELRRHEAAKVFDQFTATWSAAEKQALRQHADFRSLQ